VWTGGLTHWDTVLLLGFNSLARDPRLGALIEFISNSRLLTGTVFIAVYWYFWFDNRSRDNTEARRVVLAGIAAGVLAVIVARVLADLLPYRTRPLIDPPPGFRMPTYIGDYEAWSSFPSDNAAFVFALSLVLYKLAPRITAALTVYGFVAVCIPRITLGLHYPSDILVGAVVGTVAAWICERCVRGKAVDRLLGFSQRHAGWFYGLSFVVTLELAEKFDDVRNTARAVSSLLHRSTAVAMAIVAIVFVGALAIAALLAVLAVTRAKARDLKSPDGGTAQDSASRSAHPRAAVRGISPP
jgi:membrane-associated phospholipid phosphatase